MPRKKKSEAGSKGPASKQKKQNEMLSGFDIAKKAIQKKYGR